MVELMEGGVKIFFFQMLVNLLFAVIYTMRVGRYTLGAPNIQNAQNN